MGRRREVHVAAAAAPAVGGDDGVALAPQVGEDLAGGGLRDDRTDRDRNLEVFAATAVLFLAAAVLAALRRKSRTVAQFEERVQATVGAQDHVTAASAVTARGAPARNILLPPEGNTAPAASPADGEDLDLVDESHTPGPSRARTGALR